MKLPRPHRRLRRMRRRSAAVLAALAVVLVVVLVWVVTSAVRSQPEPTAQDVTIAVPAGPGDPGTVDLDATLFLPNRTPAPAVLLAHGFGGSKDSVADQARQLASDGFVVLTYSARGFGRSTGQIWLNDPDHEVADGRALVSWLADRPEVALDGPGDPHVGVAGSSYGGALALMLGGTDSRIDAIAAGITWYDLSQALFPNAATTEPVDLPGTPAAMVASDDGVLKRGWAGIFLGAASGAPPGPATSNPPAPAANATPGCGRFAPPICQQFAGSAVTGAPTPALAALLHSHSPAAFDVSITAPTLLVQGQRDTLFGLDQADANARAIAVAGAPVQVQWFNGGHDGDADRANGPIRGFLDAQLRIPPVHALAPPGPFGYSLPGLPNDQGYIPSRRMVAPQYPGLLGADPTPHAVLQLQRGDTAQTVVRPPGASPAAVSSVPGLGSVTASALSAAGATAFVDPPGQAATFATAPVDHALSLTGSPTVRLRVQSRAAPGESVLFAKLYDVAPDGKRVLPGGAVSAIRLPDSTAPVEVRVSLPAVTYQLPAGHHLEVAVATTDQAYATPLNPAQFTISLADDALTIPSVSGRPIGRAVPVAPLVGIGAIAGAVALIVLGASLRSRRRGVAQIDHDLEHVPLVVTDLHKRYANGFRAVDGVSFRVEPGQVLGLLGPNGAGKTTTLRMVLGLITPSAGEVRVFGHKLVPGAPVLSRVGAFVEGPGLLPHLSGADNLRLFWAATGRPEAEARLDEVLRIADLGAAIHRRVRSYSHGMRQRLAIAQAMLGLPDLLILDEPTNGLDPPQIRTMRNVLIDYARTGRTVVVSSHLLAEVEQTCTHVVVMDRGRVISAGPVRELVSAGGATEILVDDAGRAATVLAELPGIGAIEATDGAHARLRVDLGAAPASDAVRTLVSAGVAVRGLSQATRLEDVFLALVHDPRAGHEPVRQETEEGP